MIPIQIIYIGVSSCLYIAIGGFWDFTANMSFKDTAYTTEAIGPHTDNTYFTDPARLQLFHLLSHTDGEGGETVLVDGFQVAKKLCQECNQAVYPLVNYPQPFHSSGNEDVCIQPVLQAPVLSVMPRSKQLYQIRWNNYDRGPKTDWSLHEQSEWYDAARRFNELVNRMQVWYKLEPGTALRKWRMESSLFFLRCLTVFAF